MAFGGRVEAYLTVPVGVAISATNSVGGPTSVAIIAGSYSATTLLAHVVAQLNLLRPSGWTGTLSTGAVGTGRATLNCTGTWSIAWTSTTLRDALGFTADFVGVSAAQIATNGMRGLWMPDCPMQLDGDPARAPLVSDLRVTLSATGNVFGVSGSKMYRHKNIKWSHVPRSRVHSAVASTPVNCWETWVTQTQIGNAVPWVGPAASFDIYDHNEVKLGSDKPVAAWRIFPALGNVEPTKSSPDWVGLWEIILPAIVSAG